MKRPRGIGSEEEGRKSCSKDGALRSGQIEQSRSAHIYTT